MKVYPRKKFVPLKHMLLNAIIEDVY